MARINTGPVNVLGPDGYGDLEVQIVGKTLGSLGRLRILRADPQVLVSEELIEMIRTGRGHPDVAFGDNILTIRGVNRAVSYGLVTHDFARRWWLAVKAPELDSQVGSEPG